MRRSTSVDKLGIDLNKTEWEEILFKFTEEFIAVRNWLLALVPHGIGV